MGRRLAAVVARAHAEPIGSLATWADRVEAERARLLADDRPVEVLAPGPDGAVTISKPLSGLTAQISSSPKRGRQLYALIEEFRPPVAIEMGTGVGISTAYQAAACAEVGTRLLCLEGAPGLATTAASVVQRLGLSEVVDVRVGWFDDTLPDAVAGGLDYAYVDGHHEEEPTLRYHDLLVSNARPGAVLVYDDVLWSEGMKRAWAAISSDPRVAVALDLKWRGVVVLP